VEEAGVAEVAGTEVAVPVAAASVVEEVTAAVGRAVVAPVVAASQVVAARLVAVVAPPAAARAVVAVSAVEDITRASTVPIPSPGRLFRSFRLALLITSK
jgi:hypothetical protein